ncbi:MAG: 6-carboxytetrahydropterin synthase [Deltaproteobacteria bacterium]|nr:6-carboxytetrahydropterin synthase [Deltaproteobacteria bacterium]
MIIRKTFKAEAAHRILHAYSEKCRGLHGHSYVFEILIKGETQDQAQMLMDFSLISNKMKDFLNAFDHSLLIWEEDRELVEIARILNPRFMILPYNVTAEQISRHIYYQGKKIGLPIHKVIVHETLTGYAEFSGDDQIQIQLDKVIVSPAILDDINEN